MESYLIRALIITRHIIPNGNTIVSILTVQHLSYTSASITRKKPFISAGEEEMVEEDVVQKDAFDHKTELTLERLTATMSLTSVSLFGGGRVSDDTRCNDE